MSYTNVFGSNTLPPAEYGYVALTLTTDLTVVWPYNSDSTTNALAKIVNISCAAGNALTLPDATQVSTGEDFLLRNVGSNTLIVKNSAGTTLTTVLAGAASYFYLTNNSTTAGTFGVIAFGVGTSTVDAGSLVGAGIKAVGASLNQSHPVVSTSIGLTVDSTYRAQTIIFTGGADTINLTAAGTLGDDFFVLVRNNGTGTLTIDPASSELIDGQSNLLVQPSESLILVTDGTEWFSIGQGRSVLYQFTQLVKDVSAAGSFTLTAAEASNKLLTFTGNPAGAVTIIVPAVVTVYYIYSNISTNQAITVKTLAGSGAAVAQGTRVIAICDGTDVLSAQTATPNSIISLEDGSATSPSLFFATSPGTGLYASGTDDMGVSVNGVSVGVFGTAGLAAGTIGANNTQRHTTPAVASDTVALLAATQNFTNKTFTKLGIGTTPGTTETFRIQSNITGGTTAYSKNDTSTVQSGVTTLAIGNNTSLSTQAAAFTLTALQHYRVAQGTFGAGSAVTNQYAYVAALDLIGATNNYGFFSEIPSGTNRWNFYASGTAANYVAGDFLIGTTTIDAGYKFQVVGNAKITGTVSATGKIGNLTGSTVTQATSKATGVTLDAVTGQITTNNSNLNANNSVSFVLTNSSIGANDIVLLTLKSGSANSGGYAYGVESVSAGSCTIFLRNLSGLALTETLVLQFTVVAGAIA